VLIASYFCLLTLFVADDYRFVARMRAVVCAAFRLIAKVDERAAAEMVADTY